MRPDMPQILVERPRLGARFSFRTRESSYLRKGRDRARDALPKSMPMGFAASKSLNENLEPLVNFLRSRSGRHWDKVYGEIRSRLAPRNAIDMHIMQHLWSFVLFARPEPDGTTALVDQSGQTRAELTRKAVRVVGWPWGGELFYVCARTRRLVHVPPQRRKRRA